jgi:hypothetical protein
MLFNTLIEYDTISLPIESSIYILNPDMIIDDNFVQVDEIAHGYSDITNRAIYCWRNRITTTIIPHFLHEYTTIGVISGKVLYEEQ